MTKREQEQARAVTVIRFWKFSPSLRCHFATPGDIDAYLAWFRTVGEVEAPPCPPDPVFPPPSWAVH